MTDTNNETETTIPASDAPEASQAPAARARGRAADKAAGSNDRYAAVLVKGGNYAVRFANRIHRFKGKDPVTVSAELKAYLEETAFDEVTITEGDDSNATEQRPKFRFTKV